MFSIRRIAGAAAIAAALAMAPAAQAQTQTTTTPNYLPETGQQLLDLIKTCEDDSCMSYVSGAIGGIAVYALLAENPSPFCARGEVSKNDIREAIVNTIQTTEMLREQHPTVAILTAFGRYWPCMTREEIEALQSTALLPVDSDKVAALASSGQHALILGDETAPENRTILVFHDPNCSHCRRFRAETTELANRGWKVMIFPVATSSEESAGYGAVQVALRDSHPAAAEALYLNDPDSVADITLAMKVAENEGAATKDILTAIARSGAYQSVESNTQAFFDFGAQGTPAWIIGGSLYSGYLTANAIEDLGASFEGDEAYEGPISSEVPAE